METLQKEKNLKLPNISFDIKRMPELEALEIELFRQLSDSKGVIREMCSHILGAGGKRIRPLLVLYSGYVFSDKTPGLIDAAIAAELIHMASLVHDDVIDHSDLRRNRPSINRQWGNHYAVLCGDYLFAKAFGILAKARQPYSMEMMVNAIEDMCHGEILQAGTLHRKDTTIEMYYDRIAKKTAVFLANCCKSGAAAAGACNEHVQLIGSYGLNLGYAFQIIDDILDFCGKSEVIGKPVGEDFSQGIITLPIILLLQNKFYRECIENVIDKKEYSKKNIQTVLNNILQTDIMEVTFEIAKSHISIAKECLAQLPQGEGTERLYDLASMVQAIVRL